MAVAALLTSPILAAAPAHASSPLGYHTVRPQFAGSSNVNLLASIGQHVLLDNGLANGSNQLVMFNPTHNSSKVVQTVVPGGASLSASSMIAAGGAFYISWYNSTSSKDQFQRVTVGGLAHFVSLPLGRSIYWSFAFGNNSSLFATSGRFLVEIDPITRSVLSNLSSYIPKGIGVTSVLPVGTELYIAGSQVGPSGSGNPYFGFLNRTTHALTNVTTPSASTPSNLGGAFYSMYLSNGTVFVGGGLTATRSTPFWFGTVVGMFCKYTVSTGRWSNLSALLPNSTWSVFAIEPWKGSIVLSATGYASSAAGFTITGGISLLTHHGKQLTNQSFRLGPGYVADALGVTAESASYFISGGADSASGVAEVVAIRL